MSKTLNELVQDVMSHLNISKRKGTIARKITHLETCPFCRNGKSKKPRSYILTDSKKATFYCHVGSCPSGGSMSLGRLAKEQGYSKGMFEYMKFLKGEKRNVFDDLEVVKSQPNSLNYKKIDIRKELEIITLNNLYKKTIKCGLINDNLKKYLYDKRKISTDLSNVMLRNVKNGNLVIPYYNKTLDNIYYLQERTHKGDYYFLKIKDYDNEDFDFKKIYNLYNVDETKPIIVFEGVFDTFFVENSISIGGSKNVDILEKLKLFYNGAKIYYIQDNDKAGKESAVKYMNSGGHAFQWYNYLRFNNINTNIKDVNDLYEKNILTEKLTFSDIEKYFTNNTRFLNFI